MEHLSLYGRSMKGTWRGGGSFTRNPEGCVEEGSGDRYPSLGALPRNLEGGPFTRDFERWMRLVCLSIGAPLRDLEGMGVHLPGTLRIC